MAKSEATKSPSCKKPIGNSALLNLFWILTEGSDVERIKAANDMIKIIEDVQGKNETLCEELSYVLKRLIRGLSSNRKWARIGYVTTLTQVLREFEVVKVSDVLQLVYLELKPTGDKSKAEYSNILLGQVLAQLAILQSDAVLKATDEDLKKLIATTFRIHKKKSPLHQICTHVLVTLITKVSSEQFESGVWPHLKERLSVGWESCTPDILLLLITSRETHKDVVKKKFLEKHWGEKQIITSKNFAHIANIIAQSVVDHPIIHAVCPAIIHAASRKSDLFAKLWTDVIHGKIMQDSSAQKKYLGFQLIPVALGVATTSHEVEAILPSHMLEFLVRALSNPKHVMYAATRKLSMDLTHSVKTCTNPTLQVAIATRLLATSLQFDSITKTRTVADMLASFTPDAMQEWVAVLIEVVRGGEHPFRDSKSTIPLVTAKWASGTLSNLVTTGIMAEEQQLQILQFLFLQGYFTVKSTSAKIPHCEKCTSIEDSGLRKNLQDSCFRALTKLATYNPGKRTAKDHRKYVQLMYRLANYVNDLLHSPAVTSPVTKWPEEMMTDWKRMLEAVEKLHNKHADDSKMGSGHAFELLFLHLGLQLFNDPTSATEALEDLHICYEKAFQVKKRRQSMMKKSDEPEWVEVVTELLMSLLSQNSHLVRVIVTTVFSTLTPHLTKNALHIILDVLKPETSKEDGQLDFEDDEEGMEEGSDSGETTTTDSTGDKEESDSSSDESEEENDEPAEVDEKLKAAVKAALGDAAIASEDEVEMSDLDDDAMDKLDDALAAAFRSLTATKQAKKEEKERQTQLRIFKTKCLDLVSLIVSSNPSATILLELVRPMLDLMEAGVKDKAMKELAEKATGIFNKLCKPKKFLADPDLDQDLLPDMLTELIKHSTKVSGVTMVKHVATAALFVIRVLMGVESNTGPSPVKTRSRRSMCVQEHIEKKDKLAANFDKVLEIIGQGLKDFSEKRDTYLNAILFHSMLERQPGILWPLVDDLLTLGLRDDLRPYSKTQICSILAAMLTKNTVQMIGEETWKEFIKRLTTEVPKTLQAQMSEPDMKPRYIHELVLLLVRASTACSDSIKNDLDQSLVTTLEGLRHRVKHDTKTLCSKLLMVFGIRQEPLPKRKKEKKKRKSDNPQENIGSAKKPKLTNGHVSSSDASPALKSGKKQSIQGNGSGAPISGKKKSPKPSVDLKLEDVSDDEDAAFTSVKQRLEMNHIMDTETHSETPKKEKISKAKTPKAKTPKVKSPKIENTPIKIELNEQTVDSDTPRRKKIKGTPKSGRKAKTPATKA